MTKDCLLLTVQVVGSNTVYSVRCYLNRNHEQLNGMNICVYLLTEWQDYLRTQAGNTTTVNVVICTVDYLLRLQVW